MLVVGAVGKAHHPSVIVMGMEGATIQGTQNTLGFLSQVHVLGLVAEMIRKP